jgi:beta-phosphoglucomutase
VPPRALLFDFDGVLADTENIHVAAWEHTFGRMGLDVPPEVCGRAVEEDDRLFLADVLRSRSIEEGDVEGWVRWKQGLTRSMLADNPSLYPGVVELITALRGRVRLGVVTGTWRENVAIALGSSGLAEAFEVLVAKEDVPAPKPDPAGYLLALDRLKVRAADAVALEDSPSGLAAAREAGLRCVAIGQRRPRGEWCRDVPYLADLRDLRVFERAVGLG